MVTIFNHQTQKNLDTSLIQETLDIMKDFSIPCSLVTDKGLRELFSKEQAMDKIDKREYICSKHNNYCSGYYRGTNETFPRVYLDCILCCLEDHPFENEVQRNKNK